MRSDLPDRRPLASGPGPGYTSLAKEPPFSTTPTRVFQRTTVSRIGEKRAMQRVFLQVGQEFSGLSISQQGPRPVPICTIKRTNCESHRRHEPTATTSDGPFPKSIIPVWARQRLDRSLPPPFKVYDTHRDTPRHTYRSNKPTEFKTNGLTGLKRSSSAHQDFMRLMPSVTGPKSR